MGAEPYAGPEPYGAESSGAELSGAELSGAALERPPRLLSQQLRPRQAVEFTPEEQRQRRRSRRIILAVTLPAIVVGVLALVASIAASRSAPSPHPRFLPAGYRAVGDGIFSYAVPSSWTEDTAGSDNAGDLEFSGVHSWVGEHVALRTTPPSLGEAPPAALSAFGVSRPTPLQLATPVPIAIPGTQVAYRYQASRPDGFTGVAVDAWQASSGAELWMLVHADPATTSAILATLTGSG